MRRGRKQLFLKRTGNQGKRRARPTFGTALKEAKSRARQLANNRSWRREGLTSKRAAISGVGYAPPPTLGLRNRIYRILGGLAILPLCVITTHNFFHRVQDSNLRVQELELVQPFWQESAFIYFAIGFVLHAGWYLTHLGQKIFLYLYVLGHELTHAVFVYLCLGRVSGFQVGLEGGHIVTNKSNLLIALSPYFVPFWSVVSVGALAAITWFFPFRGQEHLLFAILGATWSFHIFWTLWIIPRDQPDLKENGTFLSLTVIYLINILLLSGLLCFASEDLKWREFVYEWANTCADLVSLLWRAAESLIFASPL